MINPEIFFALANILNLFANYNNIKTLWDNHNNLKGFSFKGACITVIVLTLLNIGFLVMNSWINVILLIPSIYYYVNIAYWNRPIKPFRPLTADNYNSFILIDTNLRRLK